MLTKELIGNIAEATGLSKKSIEHLLSTNNAIMREHLVAGKAVQLQGLGTLEIKERKERTIVHPRTGNAPSYLPRANWYSERWLT